MKSKGELKKTLKRINGKGYKAYKDIAGVYNFDSYALFIDHVQGDPFASPSRIRVRVPLSLADFPVDTFNTKSREVALRDFITRRFEKAAKKYVRGNRGSGKSGSISIDKPGQEILERTSAFINERHVEARFTVGLPAFGRKVAGAHAEEMFFKELPKIIDSSLIFGNLDKEKLYTHIETSEDADYLRDRLEEMGLIAFVGNGAILPRASGIDPRALEGEIVVPFKSPGSFEVMVRLPNRGNIKGMGIPEGITLIVGGGYHGKTTLLEALERGVYNHIPGDGRELVVTNPGAIKIRSEDGRSIEGVDISPFINNLPLRRSTRNFSSENASGSTSQAANIIEYLETGAGLLLIDEDTSATNFMIRDHLMQKLVSKSHEPITPFIDKVRLLYEDMGVSTVLVIGGSGDYFDVADNIICMKEYNPQNLTDKAKQIAGKHSTERVKEGGEKFGRITHRVPKAESFNPSKGKKKVKISPKGLKTIAFGRYNIDLGAVEQLVDISQTRAIGNAINYSKRYMDKERTLGEVLELVEKDIKEKGLDVLSPRPVGDYAGFRSLELAAAINRLRTLKVEQE